MQFYLLLSSRAFYAPGVGLPSHQNKNTLGGKKRSKKEKEKWNESALKKKE